MDRFKLKPCEIAKLTDWQLHHVYFHKRTKEGAIDIPLPTVEAVEEIAVTEESIIAKLELLRSMGLITEENLKQAAQEAAEKYGKDETEHGV